MDSDTLNALLDREGRPGCILSRANPGSGSIVFGGAPRLPDGVAWPRTAEGTALHFLAQIDCAALPPVARGLLPPNGALLFFALVDEDLLWDRPPQASEQPGLIARVFGKSVARRRATQVLYVPAEQGLTDATPPADLGPLYDGSTFYYRASKWPGDWSFPRAPGEVLFPRVDMEVVQATTYPDAFAFMIYGDPCRLYRRLADARLVEELAARGASIVDPHDPGADRLLRHQALGAPTWIQGAEHLHADHVLLLQIDSDRDLEWLWADVGMAQFWIRSEDLAKQRFDRAFATLGTN